MTSCAFGCSPASGAHPTCDRMTIINLRKIEAAINSGIGSVGTATPIPIPMAIAGGMPIAGEEGKADPRHVPSSPATALRRRLSHFVGLRRNVCRCPVCRIEALPCFETTEGRQMHDGPNLRSPAITVQGDRSVPHAVSGSRLLGINDLRRCHARKPPLPGSSCESQGSAEHRAPPARRARHPRCHPAGVPNGSSRRRSGRRRAAPR